MLKKPCGDSPLTIDTWYIFAISKVSGNQKTEEYLLAYYEFGIFVDSEGRRTREFDLKFTSLPVGIGMRQLFFIKFSVRMHYGLRL